MKSYASSYNKSKNSTNDPRKVATYKSQSNINLSYYKNLNASKPRDTNSKNSSSKDIDNFNLFSNVGKDKTKGKYSRYNSADKYKLYNNNTLNRNNNFINKMNKFDEIIRKSNVKKQNSSISKKEQNAYYFPQQINININNYNFSNYNSKSSYNKFRQSQASSSGNTPQIDSFQYNSNMIKNSGNSPAYIEIISPLNQKLEEQNINNLVIDNSQSNNANNYFTNEISNPIASNIQAQYALKNRNLATRQGYTADQLSNNRMHNKHNLNNKNILMGNNPAATATDKPDINNSNSNQYGLILPNQKVNPNNLPINTGQRSTQSIPVVVNPQNSSATSTINPSKKIIINKSVQKKVKEINNTNIPLKTSINSANAEESLPQIKNNKLHVIFI